MSGEIEDLARDAMRFQAKVDAIGEQIEMLAKIFCPPESEQKPDIFSVNHKPTINREEENATTEN